MVKKIAVAELKAHLSETLREVEAGGRVAIERRGKTIAVLVPPGDAASAPGDWWAELHGVLSDVKDFERIMRDAVRSRSRARPRVVRLEE